MLGEAILAFMSWLLFPNRVPENVVMKMMLHKTSQNIKRTGGHKYSRWHQQTKGFQVQLRHGVGNG